MPCGRPLNSGGAVEREVTGDGLEVGDRLQLVLVGGLLGDHDRVVVLGGRLVEHDQDLRQHLLHVLVDLVGVGAGVGLVVVERQRTGVLGEHLHRVVLERAQVDLARADVRLGGGVDALGLQRAGVDLGEQRGLGEVRHHRRRSGRRSATGRGRTGRARRRERVVGAAARGQAQERGGDQCHRRGHALHGGGPFVVLWSVWRSGAWVSQAERAERVKQVRRAWGRPSRTCRPQPRRCVNPSRDHRHGAR